MLNFRQTQCYNHRFLVFRSLDDGATYQLWQYTLTRNLDGTVTRTAVAGAHPGLASFTQNDDDPTGIGRVKRRTALTEDKLECEVSVDVDSQDLILDVSLNVDESPSLNYGQVAKVQGEPRRYPDQWPMELNYLTVQLMTEPDPPAEVHP